MRKKKKKAYVTIANSFIAEISLMFNEEKIYIGYTFNLYI